MTFNRIKLLSKLETKKNLMNLRQRIINNMDQNILRMECEAKKKKVNFKEGHIQSLPKMAFSHLFKGTGKTSHEVRVNK